MSSTQQETGLTMSSNNTDFSGSLNKMARRTYGIPNLESTKVTMDSRKTPTEHYMQDMTKILSIVRCFSFRAHRFNINSVLSDKTGQRKIK